MTRSNYIGNFLDENEDNLKLIYQRVGYLLGDSKNRQLPTGKDDLTLANDFTQYFVDKINTIRSNIEKDLGGNIPRRSYTTVNNDNIGLTTFQSVSEGAVLKLVDEMKCQLNINDPIPLSYLKKNTSYFIPCCNILLTSHLSLVSLLKI